MKSGTRRLWMVVIGAVLAGLPLLSCVLYETGSHFLLTGRFFPMDKVDELQAAVAVDGWSEDGLSLADGRTIMLPGLTSLPQESVALEAATQRGVEIGQDGRVYGLVKIHHWCGNDPVRNHIAKVDLAHMLMFLGEGEPKSALAETMFGNWETGDFSEWGWNVSDYDMFEYFEEALPHEVELLGAQHTKSSP